MTVNGIGNLFGRALDGLRVSSSAMNVTSNNIANVNTEGYNRQFFIQGTRAFDSKGFLGGGVVDLGITSLVDPFIERQLSNETADFGFYDGRQLSLSSIENLVYDSDNEGISGAISQFFNAWSELAGDPANGALREQVREAGRTMSDRFNSAHSSLQDLRQNLSSEVETRLENVNSYLEQIAKLNESVAGAVDDGAKLELKGQRQLVLRKLSKEIGVNYFEDADEMLTVQLQGTGLALVRANQSATLSSTNDLSAGGTMSISSTLAGGTSTAIDVTSYITTGAIGGNLEERNVTVNGVISDLNDLAYQISTDVNNLHYNGFGLDGNDQRNFFTPLADADNAAGLIAIDPAVLNSLDAIAAAQADPSGGAVGDSRVAGSIVDLRNALSMSGGAKTYTQFYSSLTASVGVKSASVKANAKAKSNLVQKLEQQRENISGVNLDEEAADLLKYQKAFEGAARVMSVANEMLDTLLKL